MKKVIFLVAALLIARVSYGGPPDVDKGKEIFNKFCVECHGDDGGTSGHRGP